MSGYQPTSLKSAGATKLTDSQICICANDDKKIALVTGSATGIGANIALDLAANDYFVILTGRDELKLQKVADDCNKISRPASHSSCQSREDGEKICDAHSATYFPADLTSFEQLNKLIEFVLSKFRRLDVLVNNACWRGCHQHLLECAEAYTDFKQVMHLNVAVPLYLIQQCLISPRDKENIKKGTSHLANEAVVINVSSIASQVVVPLHAYSISKACLSELSRQLAQSSCYSNLGIISVTISPGPVLTNERPHHQAMSDLTLMNRVGTTQDISNLVLFAISNAKMFNGQELNIDGGYVVKQQLPLKHST